MVALTRLRFLTRPGSPHPPPARPPPIESIRDITGSEKIIQKTISIQVAGRNSYEMIAIYVTTLSIYISGVTVLYHKRRIVHSIFQIRIS